MRPRFIGSSGSSRITYVKLVDKDYERRGYCVVLACIMDAHECGRLLLRTGTVGRRIQIPVEKGEAHICSSHHISS